MIKDSRKKSKTKAKAQIKAENEKEMLREINAYLAELDSGRDDFNKGHRSSKDMERIKVRLEHMGKFIIEGNKYTKRELGFDHKKYYGVPENFSKVRIPQNLKGPDNDAQVLPMLYSNQFVEELLAIPKFKLWNSDKDRGIPHYVKKKFDDGTTFHIFETYCAGVHKDQVVLFKEEVIYPTKKNAMGEVEDFKDYGSYELKAIIGGKHNGVFDIIRFDHNSGSHGNAFKGGFIWQDNFPVYGSHVHYHESGYNVIFPNKIDSSDAWQVDTSDLTFFQGVIAIRNATNQVLCDPIMVDKDSAIQQVFMPIAPKVVEANEKYAVGVKTGLFIDRFNDSLNLVRDNKEKFEDLGPKPIIRGEEEAIDIINDVMGD